MSETRAVLYCTRMNRPCTCGELVTYDQSARLVLSGGSMQCLSNSEVRTILDAVLTECSRRFCGSGTPRLLAEA
jgi:hypothetical protein